MRNSKPAGLARGTLAALISILAISHASAAGQARAEDNNPDRYPSLREHYDGLQSSQKSDSFAPDCRKLSLFENAYFTEQQRKERQARCVLQVLKRREELCQDPSFRDAEMCK